MNNDQLIQFLELLKTDVINSLQANGKNATGQTAKQFIITGDGGKVQLQLPGYMQLLETGRGPTSPNAVAGNPIDDSPCNGFSNGARLKTYRTKQCGP